MNNGNFGEEFFANILAKSLVWTAQIIENADQTADFIGKNSSEVTLGACPGVYIRTAGLDREEIAFCLFPGFT